MSRFGQGALHCPFCPCGSLGTRHVTIATRTRLRATLDKSMDADDDGVETSFKGLQRLGTCLSVGSIYTIMNSYLRHTSTFMRPKAQETALKCDVIQICSLMTTIISQSFAFSLAGCHSSSLSLFLCVFPLAVLNRASQSAVTN